MITTYAAQMAAAYAPITVLCPFCRAFRGQPCQSSSGYQKAGFHAARERRIEHLTEDEVIEAVAAWRAELEQTRAAVVEALGKETP